MEEPTNVNSNSRGSSYEDGLNVGVGFGSKAPDYYAEIIVMRHGKTNWNADGRVQGHLDVELNEVGRQQAAAVADWLSKESKTSAVYSFDLKRAFETIHIIASCYGVHEVVQDPDLRERNLGDLQGLVWHEATELKPNAYQVCTSSRTDQEIPVGGESFDQLYHRCTSSLQRIGTNIGERVVVVTHGGVMWAIHRRAAPIERQPRKILNASVNIFHISGEEWIIKTLSDVNHLKNIGLLENAFGGDGASGECLPQCSLAGYLQFSHKSAYNSYQLLWQIAPENNNNVHSDQFGVKLLYVFNF